MASKLQQGISILYDMELNNYLMTRTINDLNYNINNSGRINNYYRGKEPVRKSAYFDFEEHGELSTIVCTVLGIIVGLIIGIIDGDGFFSTIFSIIVYGIISAIVGLVIGGIIGAINSFNIMKREQAEYDKKYSKEISEYKNRIENDNTRISNEYLQKEYLIMQRDILVKKRKDSINKLNKFYNTMKIDVKYRNIIPIGYMYEFMNLGIANKLEGTNGLYYLVRQELRADQLMYSLDDISRKLDTIINNQRELYYEISDMNAKCDKMIANAKKSAEISAQNNKLLNQAVANTSISAYNSERIKEELRFQNFMMIYNS